MNNPKRNREAWEIRKARRKEQVASPKELMLRDFLRATTPYEKRKVIETFNPHYFLLTTQGDANERLQTSL